MDGWVEGIDGWYACIVRRRNKTVGDRRRNWWIREERAWKCHKCWLNIRTQTIDNETEGERQFTKECLHNVGEHYFPTNAYSACGKLCLDEVHNNSYLNNLFVKSSRDVSMIDELVEAVAY